MNAADIIQSIFPAVSRVDALGNGKMAIYAELREEEFVRIMKASQTRLLHKICQDCGVHFSAHKHAHRRVRCSACQAAYRRLCNKMAMQAYRGKHAS